MRLAINALEEELAQAAEFCRTRGIGLEVTAFAFPKKLDDGFEQRVGEHRAVLQGIAPLSCHGPFQDLYPASGDPAVVRVARERHERAFEAALALGVQVYVAHVSSIPLIRNKSYRDRFARATADFWLPFAERAREAGMVIALENLWEAGPEVQAAIMDRAEHPALRASFDNGHALVFGEHPSAEWVAALGDRLAHCHLHDNDRSSDQHLPIGQGKEDWSALFAALAHHAPEAVIVLESDTLEQNAASLEAAAGYATLDGG